MMGRVVALFVVGVLTMASSTWAQERSFSVALKASLTTASRLFTDPSSQDVLQRSQYYALEDFFGYGVELRYQLPETHLALGLSAEYIETTISHSMFLSTTKSVPVEEGYIAIPVELTGYFLIPVSGHTFGVFMGGGVGGYFGKRIYKLGDTEAATTRPGHGFGIHVLGGLSYRFTEWFSLSAEMKFRDLQFQTTNQFATSLATYQGMPITVSRAPKDARVHTDGVIFQLGTVFNF
jgi:opacity protein-like surface antigen